VYQAGVGVKKYTGDLRSLLVASFFGAALVLCYSILSCCLLFGLTIRKKKRKAGFWYGFMTSSAVNLGFVALLCSLVLHGYRSNVISVFEHEQSARVEWSSTDTAVFVATYIVGYVATGFYFILFGILYYGRTKLQWEEGEGRDESLLG